MTVRQDSETMLWKEKERSRVRAVQQMDNLRGLLGIKRMNKVPNARIKGLFRMEKGLVKRLVEASYEGEG